MKNFKLKSSFRTEADVIFFLDKIKKASQGLSSPYALNAGFPSIEEAKVFLEKSKIHSFFVRLKNVPVNHLFNSIDSSAILYLYAESKNENGKSLKFREYLDLPLVDWNGIPNWTHEISITDHQSTVDDFAISLGIDEIPKKNIRGKGVHKVSQRGDAYISNIYNLASSIEGRLMEKLLLNCGCEFAEEVIIKIDFNEIQNSMWTNKFWSTSPGGFRSPVWIGMEPMGGIEYNLNETQIGQAIGNGNVDFVLSKNYLSFPYSKTFWTKFLRQNSISVSVRGNSIDYFISVDRYFGDDPKEQSVLKEINSRFTDMTELN